MQMQAQPATLLNIGYQGEVNSNNHRAARTMAERLPGGPDTARLIPLISSAGVVRALQNGEIDLGVMAFQAINGWQVPETREACDGLSLEIVDTVTLEVHHCLFKKRPDIRMEELRTVASHPAALLVCSGNLEELLPGRVRQEMADTALCAGMLARGELSEDTAVICSREAGEQFGLSLIRTDMQNVTPNGVIFKMVRLAKTEL